MFISKREYYVEVHGILKEDEEFTQNDLEPNVLVGNRLMELSSRARSEIAHKLGYQQMYWSGHYDPETRTVQCSFRNPAFIDEKTNTVMITNK